MAVWPWYGALVKGQLYGAGEFLQVQDYRNVQRWTEQIAQRPAVQRGRMVNRTWGEPASQLHERHDASDFDTPHAGQAGDAEAVITLYDCATAPSPRRARILLAEKGVAHETVQIDLRGNEQLGEAFRRINPQCTVPALRTEDGLVLTDNAAIAAYLEARYPEPPLLGGTPQEKAEVASWNWRVEFEGLLPIAEAMRNTRAGDGQPRPARAGATMRRSPSWRSAAWRGCSTSSRLNDRLADREFIAGERFSIADITAVVAVDFARVVRVKPGEQHPHLLRWRAAMAQRPSMSL